MAGIWERVRGDVPEGWRRINVSFLRTELLLVGMGVRTRADAKTHIEGELGLSLSVDETTDLDAIADEIEAGTIQSKLVYAAKMEACLNAAELRKPGVEMITETEFRTVLGI